MQAQGNGSESRRVSSKLDDLTFRAIRRTDQKEFPRRCASSYGPLGLLAGSARCGAISRGVECHRRHLRPRPPIRGAEHRPNVFMGAFRRGGRGPDWAESIAAGAEQVTQFESRPRSSTSATGDDHGRLVRTSLLSRKHVRWRVLWLRADLRPSGCPDFGRLSVTSCYPRHARAARHPCELQRASSASRSCPSSAATLQSDGYLVRRYYLLVVMENVLNSPFIVWPT